MSYYDDDLREEISDLRDWFQTQLAGAEVEQEADEISELLADYEDSIGEQLTDEEFDAVGYVAADQAARTGVLDVEAAYRAVFSEEINYGEKVADGLGQVERTLGRPLFEEEKKRLWEVLPENDEPDVVKAWDRVTGGKDPFSAKSLARDGQVRRKAAELAAGDAWEEAVEAEEAGEPEVEEIKSDERPTSERLEQAITEHQSEE